MESFSVLSGKKDFHSGFLRLEGLSSTIAVVVRPAPSVENSITKHRDKAQIIASILEVTSSSGGYKEENCLQVISVIQVIA